MITFILILCLSVTVRFSWAKTDIQQAGNSSQSSLCIDTSLVQEAAKTDGITDPANPDKFAKSATASNNFINFCAGHKLTNGEQVAEGSCNPTPMGLIPSSENMPSVRILSPSPTVKIAAHKDFNVVIAVQNIEMGFFTSPKNTYYLAPQQLNDKGQIKGHLHLVIQLVQQESHLDPLKFVFFKGIAESAVDGKLNLAIPGGLPDGIYRISTLTSAMNHQPVILPIAKRGAVDDAIYIVVGTGVSSPEKAGGDTAPPQQKSSLLSVEPHDNIKGEGNGKGSNVENADNSTTNGTKNKKKKKKVCRAKKRGTRSKR